MMWVLVVNGLVYLAFIYLHGEWRDLVPRRGVVRDVGEMVRVLSHDSKGSSAAGKAQRAATTGVLLDADRRGRRGGDRNRDLEAGRALATHEPAWADTFGRATGTSRDAALVS